MSYKERPAYLRVMAAEEIENGSIGGSVYTLVTRNEKNFDERGIERTFSSRAGAIRAGRAFMKKASCAGASAIVFHQGWTVFSATTTGEKVAAL